MLNGFKPDKKLIKLNYALVLCGFFTTGCCEGRKIS
jgi:hypothetical protein